MYIAALLYFLASFLLFQTSAFRVSLPGSSLRFGSVIHKNINQLARAVEPQHADNEQIGIGVQASTDVEKEKKRKREELMNKTPYDHFGPWWTYEMVRHKHNFNIFYTAQVTLTQTLSVQCRK